MDAEFILFYFTVLFYYFLLRYVLKRAAVLCQTRKVCFGVKTKKDPPPPKNEMKRKKKPIGHPVGREALVMGGLQEDRGGAELEYALTGFVEFHPARLLQRTERGWWTCGREIWVLKRLGVVSTPQLLRNSKRP